MLFLTLVNFVEFLDPKAKVDFYDIIKNYLFMAAVLLIPLLESQIR